MQDMNSFSSSMRQCSCGNSRADIMGEWVGGLYFLQLNIVNANTADF